MRNPTTYPGIPISLLAHLVDLAGMAGDMSPRHLWPAAAPDSRQARELYDAGITTAPEVNTSLTANFAPIARTLLNPATNLTFRAWGDSYSAVESNIQFPGRIRDGGGVALNQANGLFRISAYFNDLDILNQLVPLMPSVPDSEQTLTFEAHLPTPLAVTLMAVLDLCRGMEFPSGPYTSATVNGYIQGQWGLTGFDKLLGFLPALGVSTKPPSQTAVEAALETLASLAFLDEVSDGFYELGIELLPLVGRTRGELPGLQWQRVHSGEDGTLLTANRIWLYGSKGLILMLAPMTDSSVFIQSVRPATIMEFISGELTGPVAVTPKAVGAPKAHGHTSLPVDCSKCGAAIARGAKFCAACGSPLDQHACPQCKATIPGTASFCPSCGQSLDQPAPRKKIQSPAAQNRPQPITRFPLMRAALLMGSISILFIAAILTAYLLANPRQPTPPWRSSSKEVASQAPDVKTGKTPKETNAQPKTANSVDLKAPKKNKKATQKATEAKALYDKAEDYYHGRNGVEKDYAKAMSFYRRAADRGNSAAESSIGYMYAKGQGVEKDDSKGFLWTQKAADHGDDEAQRNLGIMYKAGLGVDQNITKAMEWLLKAADQGNDKAQHNLAHIYFRGEAVPTDYTKALKYFRQSADQGNKNAQANIGAMYFNGHGVTQNYQTALDWFHKAAEKGHLSAQFYIGFMNENGQGVAKNKAAAIEWYRKAAKQGDASAQERLKALGEDY